jgi:RNA polymerase sigma factor (sigma-70 family)
LAVVTIHDGCAFIDVDVSDEFAAVYADMDRQDRLLERKETRRHQSLNKSMEHGFDVPDDRVDVIAEQERYEITHEMKYALNSLTEKQRTVVVFYCIYKMSFREIGDKMNMSKVMARKHYFAGITKLKKILGNRLSN